MVTREEFASLLLIGTPSTSRRRTVIPPKHRSRLIALGYLADIGGGGKVAHDPVRQKSLGRRSSRD